MRAELIDGELWGLATPSRLHQRIVFQLARLLEDHIKDRGGTCKVNLAPCAVNLFGDESCFVEPDVTVVCDRDKLSDRGCEGAPDLVVEVTSPSSVSMDCLTKLNLYRDAGVREYWILDPLKERVLVYALSSDTDLLAVFPFSVPASSTALAGFTADIARIIREP